MSERSTSAGPTFTKSPGPPSELARLSAMEQRVLGGLLEKQSTVPGSYPLSLNGVRSACNQSSSRDPVTDYDEADLELCLRELKARGLVRVVWASKGSRTLKYHQILDEALGLADDERALITALLLRGPQAPGELKTRTDRLHRFDDRAAVEACLQRMSTAEPALVQQLERTAGQQDHRWAHLFAPLPAGPLTAVAVDREIVLADGAEARDARVRQTYEAAAESYSRRLRHELDDKPFDSWLLSRVARLPGPILDVGCGPGHVTDALSRAGTEVKGIDLSPAMVTTARGNFPDLNFEVGNLFNLLRPRTASGWGVVVSWYSLVHLAGSELPRAISSMARVLQPGGWLLLGLPAGSSVHRLEEFEGAPCTVDFVEHDPSEVRAAVEQAGLSVVESYLRSPLADVENQVDRLYVLARAAATASPNGR